MKHLFRKTFLLLSAGGLLATQAVAATFNVRDHGATGDGETLDTDAINAAIEAAAGSGGGTVLFPAGDYLSFSIRLKSNIRLYLDAGATIVAASPEEHDGGYDLADPNPWHHEHGYQDYGHSHWKDSLIWGIGIENVTIEGPGTIFGKGLVKWDTEEPGYGNKAIALKECRNVTLRDFTIRQGGHFGILPTAVDDFLIDGLTIDTNRDAINIDACKNVRISNCTLNSPNDDAIVLKSSYALGEARITENVTITNCQLSGFDEGTLLDGTYGRTQEAAPDGGGVTGRIKFGTESNGGFRNITISNIVFERARGLALETVDGGFLEDVTISNITMREVEGSPLFLRLGARMRGPDGVEPGELRRITISNLNAYDVDPAYSVMIMGIPGHNVEDVMLNNIRLHYRGGGTEENAERDVPEDEAGYPDPWEFVRGGREGESGFGGAGAGGTAGWMPAYGFFIRHAAGITLNNVKVGYAEEDRRPAIILDDVDGIDLINVDARAEPDRPRVFLRNVREFSADNVDRIDDQQIENAEQLEL